jgi:hypothetical protein
MQALLDRFLFLNRGGVGVSNIVDRGNIWFGEAEARGADICRFDGSVYSINKFEPLFIMQQAHDAYILGLLDAVPVLCRTAIEEELTIRYLAANNLIQQVVAGNPFKTFIDGTTPATLENLIRWAARTATPILSSATETLARDIQKAGNDYAHAYAMRRVGRPMAAAGNVFTNTKALDVYEKTLNVLNQMP